MRSTTVRGLAEAGFVALLGAFFSVATPAHADLNYFRMAVGTQKVLTIPGLRSATVANPTVAEVKIVAPGQVLVAAKERGSTELTVQTGKGATTYRIHVPAKLYCGDGLADFHDILGKPEDILAPVEDGKVHLEGSANSTDDLLRIHKVLLRYPTLQNQVTVSSALARAAERSIGAELGRRGLVQVHVTLTGSTLSFASTSPLGGDARGLEDILEAMIEMPDWATGPDGGHP